MGKKVELIDKVVNRLLEAGYKDKRKNKKTRKLFIDAKNREFTNEVRKNIIVFSVEGYKIDGEMFVHGKYNKDYVLDGSVDKLIRALIRKDFDNL